MEKTKKEFGLSAPRSFPASLVLLSISALKKLHLYLCGKSLRFRLPMPQIMRDPKSLNCSLPPVSLYFDVSLCLDRNYRNERRVIGATSVSIFNVASANDSLL